ncbi:MAG: threonine ammonia-lyase [Gemmatimonadales bacterium]
MSQRRRRGGVPTAPGEKSDEAGDHAVRKRQVPVTPVPVTLEAIQSARQRIRGVAITTPLVPFLPAPSPARIYLKLENLQPIGSFKIRGAANAMRLAGPAAVKDGVLTASAGNMAQGVAWCAREFSVPCRVVVPETAPASKLAAIERLGGELIRVPFDRWWQTLLDGAYPGVDGVFVHPFADAGVMAGNGTIGLEIIEQLADVDTVLVPWGGGGLACGIASAVRATRPAVRVYAVEIVGAAPLAASFAAGAATTIDPVRSFVDGIGGKSVTAEMWTLARSLLAGVLTVRVADVATAVRQLALSSRVVAEGAGAASVAAAQGGVPGASAIACIVSGGNIDAEKLAIILHGGIP